MQDKSINIVLTCDDGIYSKGMLELIKSIDYPHVKLFVCAPDSERSASSHSLTFNSPLIVKKVTLLNDDRVEAWSVNGTPCDCVKLAIENLVQKKPDLLLSGVNNGLNLGTDIYYSGTVSAAREGVLNNIPSVAFSVQNQDENSFKIIKQLVNVIIDMILLKGLDKGTLLNVNVPLSACNHPSPKVKATVVGELKYSQIFDERTDPRGRTYYWLSGYPQIPEKENETDVSCINGGFVSISPIKIDLTNYEFFEKLKGWSLT